MWWKWQLSWTQMYSGWSVSMFRANMEAHRRRDEATAKNKTIARKEKYNFCTKSKVSLKKYSFLFLHFVKLSPTRNRLANTICQWFECQVSGERVRVSHFEIVICFTLSHTDATALIWMGDEYLARLWIRTKRPQPWTAVMFEWHLMPRCDLKINYFISFSLFRQNVRAYRPL